MAASSTAGVHTVEGNQGGARAAAIALKREAGREAFEAAKADIAARNSGAFQRLVTTAPAATADAAPPASSGPTAPAAASGGSGAISAVAAAKRRAGRGKRAARATLSFADADGEEEGADWASAAPRGGKRARLGKDPTAATDFLPDADRAAAEAQLVAQLKAEWREQQEKLKAEPLHVTYSYYDGSGHRRDVSVTKGTTIAEFLEVVRKDLVQVFPEMKRTNAGSLLYIKEDLILPHNLTFYELIVTKARGKSGPLFEFGVRDDLRLQGDARQEVSESHPGKIVERRWFEANKHIFPASRWEVYDPAKHYDKYTVRGGDVRK